MSNKDNDWYPLRGAVNAPLTWLEYKWSQSAYSL